MDNSNELLAAFPKYWGKLNEYIKALDKEELYKKFSGNIHPPQNWDECFMISKGKVHSEKDYNEMIKILSDFCGKYPFTSVAMNEY